MLMSAVLDTRDSDATARLETRALEKMIRALCGDIERLANGASARGELDSREAKFQLQAFAERRADALQQLEHGPDEPSEMRIARLERLIETLGCSRAYFRAGIPGTT